MSGRHLLLHHVLVESRGEAEDGISLEVRLGGDTAHAAEELHQISLVGGGRLPQLVDSRADADHLRLEVAARISELLGTLGIDLAELADGHHGTIAQHVAQSDIFQEGPRRFVLCVSTFNTSRISDIDFLIRTYSSLPMMQFFWAFSNLFSSERRLLWYFPPPCRSHR